MVGEDGGAAEVAEEPAGVAEESRVRIGGVRQALGKASTAAERGVRGGLVVIRERDPARDGRGRSVEGGGCRREGIGGY